MKFFGLFARIALKRYTRQRLGYLGNSQARGIYLLMLTISLSLSQTLIGGTVVDFRQAANNDSSFGLQNIHWINSIIQDNNSMYFEGMSVRQRLLFTGLPSTSGNHHSLLFRHQFSKGNVHTYDYLTSYTQAGAEDIADFGAAAILNPCGNDIGPPSSLA